MTKKPELSPVKKEKKNICPCDDRWKARNPFGCGKPCDWAGLPYEKDAILKRMKTENKLIQDIKQKIIDGKFHEKELAYIMDVTQGMQIMADALIEDMGISEDEIKKEVGFKKDSWSNKVKLAMRLQEMKRQRGKKSR